MKYTLRVKKVETVRDVECYAKSFVEGQLRARVFWPNVSTERSGIGEFHHDTDLLCRSILENAECVHDIRMMKAHRKGCFSDNGLALFRRFFTKTYANKF